MIVIVRIVSKELLLTISEQNPFISFIIPKDAINNTS